MIGRLFSSFAGKVIARSVGGVQAGRIGAFAGFAMPSILPVMRRRLGPAGMMGLAFGGIVGKRLIERRQMAHAQKDVSVAATATSAAAGDPAEKTPPPASPLA